MYSFLVDMRKRGLNPWLDNEGYIHITYVPDDAYFNFLKQNKRLTLVEIGIESRTGIRLDAMQNISCPT